jgi:quinol monooxygenase YgiN
MNVRPEKRKELAQTLYSIVGQVRKEGGCLQANFYQDVENETEFIVVEEWASEKELDDHLQSDIFTILMGAGSLMRLPPETVVYTVRHSKNINT